MRRMSFLIAAAVAAMTFGAGPAGADSHGEPPIVGGVPAADLARGGGLTILLGHFGPGTETLDCSTFPTCNATGTGTGILQGLGRGTFENNDTWTFTGNCGPDTAQFDFVGVLVWTAANGDELHIAKEGELCVNFVTQTLVFRCTTFTVIGGTGRFSDATSDPATFCD